MWRFILFLLLVLWTWQVQAALSIEGTASTSGNSATVCPSGGGTLDVTTTSANDILVVVVGADNTNGTGSAPAVTGIATTGAGTLNLIKRSAFSVHAAGSGTAWIDVEVWYILATSSGLYHITTTFGSTYDNCAVIGFGVAGANTTTPWDTSGSLPATANGTGSVPTISSVSTVCDKTMLLMAVEASQDASGYADQTAGTGFTIIANQIASAGTNFSKAAAQQDIVATPQSGISTAFAVSWVSWIASVDAIQDATASCGAAETRRNLLLMGVSP